MNQNGIESWFYVSFYFKCVKQKFFFRLPTHLRGKSLKNPASKSCSRTLSSFCKANSIQVFWSVRF